MRFEHKYVVPEPLLPALRRILEPFARPDRHAAPGGENGWRQYVVRSIYFDTPGLMHYFETENGVDPREKPRIRAYGERRAGATVYLEVKRRRGPVTAKQRAPVALESLEAVLAGRGIGMDSRAGADERSSAASFIFHLRRDALRPTILVVYDREPYVGVFEPSLRVTFDRRLRSVAWPRANGLFEQRGARASLAGSFVLEVKHDAAFGFPVWLRPFIAEHGLVRQALSKYWVCGADQHLPDAPIALRRSAGGI